MLGREVGSSEGLVETAAELRPEHLLIRYVTPEVALPDELNSEESAAVHLTVVQPIRDRVASQAG